MSYNSNGGGYGQGYPNQNQGQYNNQQGNGFGGGFGGQNQGYPNQGGQNIQGGGPQSQMNQNLGRPNQGYPPQNNQGYPPQNNQGYLPQNNQGCPPQNNQGYHPQNNQVYPPQNNQGYLPQNNQVYPPQNNQGYPPQNNQGYPPQNNQGYPPQNNQGYPPQNNQGYPPKNNQGYPPKNNQGYPPQANQGYPSQTNQGYPPAPQSNQGNNSSTHNSSGYGKHDTLKWVKVQGNNIPENAIKGGNEKDGTPLFIGRAPHKASLVIGKASKKSGGLMIPYDGKEVHYPSFEVLTGDIQSIKWRECRGNFFIKGWKMVDSGYEKDGRKLFVGRAELKGKGKVIGKVAEHFACGMVYGYDTEERFMDKDTEYEVLTYA